MANDVQYRGLRTSDDSIEWEDEPYLRRGAGLFGSLKDRSFSSKYSVKWHGMSPVFLYMLSVMLLLASSRFPTERQCTSHMFTWCKLIPPNTLQNLKIIAIKHL